MMDAIFTITDSTWVEIIWYVPIEGSDLLAMLFREPANGPWQLTFRFRHYVDDKDPFTSDDTKSVYDMKLDNQATAKEDLIKHFDTLTTSWAEKLDGEVHRLVVRGHAKKALKLLAKQPWSHRRTVPLPPTSKRVQ